MPTPAQPTIKPVLTSELGKLLKMASAAEPAVRELTTARQQFQTLVEAGNSSAARMAAVADAEIGDCLAYLRRLQDAATAYEAALAQADPGSPLRVRLIGCNWDWFTSARASTPTLPPCMTLPGAPSKRWGRRKSRPSLAATQYGPQTGWTDGTGAAGRSKVAVSLRTAA